MCAVKDNYLDVFISKICIYIKEGEKKSCMQSMVTFAPISKIGRKTRGALTRGQGSGADNLSDVTHLLNGELTWLLLLLLLYTPWVPKSHSKHAVR